MIRFITFFGLCLFLTLSAHATEPGVFTAERAYAYATTSVQKNGAVFLKIKNHDNRPAKLIGVIEVDVEPEDAIAERIELHTHIMDGDVMMMRAVEGYEVPAGETITLEPTGHHIMLMGLKAPLKAGEHFNLTLMFEEPHHHYALDVVVEIKNPGDAP